MTREKPLLISIDHRMSMAALVRLGRYTGLSKAVLLAPRMKERKAAQYEVRIFHFDEIIGSKEARKRIEKAGWNVATIEQLLALGALLPHLQRQFPIVALGTTWKGAIPRAACLHHGDGLKRYVVLRWIGDDWCGDFAFMAVRTVLISSSLVSQT